MANTLDGTFISPFSNITLARFGIPWQFRFVSGGTVLDFENFTDLTTAYNIMFPSETEALDPDEALFRVRFSVSFNGVVADVAMVAAFDTLNTIIFNKQYIVSPDFGSLPLIESGDTMGYDQSTEVFKWPSRHSEFIIPSGTENYGVDANIFFIQEDGNSKIGNLSFVDPELINPKLNFVFDFEIVEV